MYFVYIATNTLTAKSYIGKTKNPFQRIREHLLISRKGKAYGPKYSYFQRSINKYGAKNFSWRIVEAYIPQDAVNEREIFWIRSLETRTPNGYNCTDGGEGTLGYIQTPETLKKKSEKLRGKKRTEEQKRHLSIVKTGRKMSEEHKRKCRERMLGNTYGRGNKSRTGWKHTEEQKLKQSERMRYNIPWNKGKVGIYSAETLAKFRSAAALRHSGKERSPYSYLRVLQNISDAGLSLLVSLVDQRAIFIGEVSKFVVVKGAKNRNQGFIFITNLTTEVGSVVAGTVCVKHIKEFEKIEVGDRIEFSAVVKKSALDTELEYRMCHLKSVTKLQI